MSVELRLPKISGTTEKEQIAQLKSYLYQMTEQLQWALNNVGSTYSENYVVEHRAKAETPVSSFDSEVAFSALKPLIIKSADIVEAYYEEINKKLEGLYVAESDFGTFVEKTELDITETSEYVDQKYSDVQAIVAGINDDVGKIDVTIQGVMQDVESKNNTLTDSIDAIGSRLEDEKGKTSEALDKLRGDLDSLNATVVEVNAHIRSGLLYYDDNEVPVYGLEVGQKNTVDGVEVFNKYARFTSSRLSFYDANDNEVAYISDYKLYIRNVEITGSFKMGGFEDTVTASGDIVTKWVGGNA
jgi:hypothetical protein